MIQPPIEPPSGAHRAQEPSSGSWRALSPGELPGCYDGPDLVEPTDAELLGLWPDPFAGPPDDGDAWLTDLSPSELDAVFAGLPDDDPGPSPGFAAGGPLNELAPGPVLAGFAKEAFDAGLARLCDDEVVGVLCAARRLSSWQAGLEIAAVAELDRRRRQEAARPGWSGIGEHVSAELAVALALTARSADELLSLSRELTRIPAVLAALLAGRLDRARAVVFASELSGLGDVAAAAVAAAFCPAAGSMTTGQLRAALRVMVLAIDPAAAQRRAERGRRDARVEAWGESSGNGALAGRELPAAEAIAADRRITAIARALKEAGAPGSMDELRAAVFSALLTGRDPESLAPGGSGADEPCAPDPAAGRSADWVARMAGSVNLTMSASAWLGRSEAVGEAAGFGPLDATTCRELAARTASGPGARWCVTLTGSDGRAVAHACARAGPGPGPPPTHEMWLRSLEFAWLERGTCAHARESDSYRPSSGLRHLVKIRQRTCGFPGCRRPAAACDDDHTTPHDQGGRTCECNLAPLCRRHHRCKQAPGWQLVQTEPGVLTWTAPHGRSYTVYPDAYPV